MRVRPVGIELFHAEGRTDDDATLRRRLKKKQRAVFQHSNPTEFQVTCQLQTKRIYNYILLATQVFLLDTGFSRFPCVYKQTLRRFPTFQVATTCFSCSPPDLNLLDPYFILMYMHNNHCHRVTTQL